MASLNVPWAEAPADGDFSALLQRAGRGLSPEAAAAGALSAGGNGHGGSHDRLAQLGATTEATTVLSFHYKDGVVIAGDRRATAGNLLMYDRADKVIEIDSETVIAIAGTPATAFEMARVLQHSFQYYRRSQLQPLSLEAKVRALGKLLRDNLPMTMQGVGVVVPILAARETHPPHGQSGAPQLYFYDVLGATFLAADFAVSGSGSGTARSILQFINRWSGRPTKVRDEAEAIRLALQLLDTAAESDTATGGIDRRSEIFPQVKLLTKDGLRSVSIDELKASFTEGV